MIETRQTRVKLVAIALLVFVIALAIAARSTMSRDSTGAGEAPSVPSTTSLPFEAQRQRMVTQHLQGRDIDDESVLAAMGSVPRHQFVPEEYLPQAYADHPLPIGYGQTISQPYIVALMTQLAAVGPGDRVLEVGTGSGYQAAVLAALDAEVYSVEIIPELAQTARQRLDEAGWSRVQTAVADGYYGWAEHAPYDAIVVTAAPDHVPQPLSQQLADGGRMVIPIGPPGAYQVLWLIERHGESFTRKSIAPVRFVPLTGDH